MGSKRPLAASDAVHWGSKRRKTSFAQAALTGRRRPTDTTRPDPVVAVLLALTDPEIVATVMSFAPLSKEITRGEATRRMGTLVRLCRAFAPFDHRMPQHFGPHNQCFWRRMVVQSFDFSSSDSGGVTVTSNDSASPELAYWPRLGVSYLPSEFGFLQKCQTQGEDLQNLWPQTEDAFTLYCDLALLVDNVRGVAVKRGSVPRFVPCIRTRGSIARPARESPLRKDETADLSGLLLVRRSKKQAFVELIAKHLQRWTHFHEASGGSAGRDEIHFHAGRSRRSKRWLGLTSVKTRTNPPE